MGGPSGGNEFTPTQTRLDPTLRPYVDTALSEAERLRQAGGPAYYGGQTYVSPSQATQSALAATQARASAGSPLVRQAQSTMGSMMTSQSPYQSQYANLAGQTSKYGSQFENIAGQTSPYQQQFAGMAQNAYVDPSSGFYAQMRAGQMQNEALGGTRATAEGAYLGGSPYLAGSLSQANRLATEAFQSGMGDIQAKAAAAGRYGSGAMGQLVGKQQDVLARSLAEQNQMAYQRNYEQERAAQEAAISRLGGLSQQGFANQLMGAQQLGSAAQQAYANQMGATQAAQGVYGADLANRMAATGAAQDIYQGDYANQMAALSGAQGVRQADIATQMAAAQAAPGLAAADYADLERMLAAGQVGEGYTAAQQEADKARYDYTAQLPYQTLQNYGAFITGLPRGGITEEYIAPQTEEEKAIAAARNTTGGMGYQSYIR